MPTGPHPPDAMGPASVYADHYLNEPDLFHDIVPVGTTVVQTITRRDMPLWLIIGIVVTLTLVCVVVFGGGHI